MKTIITIMLLLNSTPVIATEQTENFDYCVWAYNSHQNQEYLNNYCDIETVEAYIFNVKLWVQK